MTYTQKSGFDRFSPGYGINLLHPTIWNMRKNNYSLFSNSYLVSDCLTGRLSILSCNRPVDGGTLTLLWQNIDLRNAARGDSDIKGLPTTFSSSLKNKKPPG